MQTIIPLNDKSKVELSARGKKAAKVRWSKGDIPYVTHRGFLQLGEISIPCGILNTGQAVLITSDIFKAINKSYRGRRADKRVPENIPDFIDAKNLQGFFTDELRKNLTPIEFKDGLQKGYKKGYDAQIIPQICWVYNKAALEGKLLESQKPQFRVTSKMLEAFSGVGIVALVREASGYLEEAKRDAISRIVEQYVQQDLRPWVKHFPIEFYQQIARLKGYKIPNTNSETGHVYAQLTNELVYKRLAPGVLKELKSQKDRLNKNVKYHQFLNEKGGVRSLNRVLDSCVALMFSSDSYEEFLGKFDRIFKVYPEHMSEKDLLEFEAKGSRLFLN